MTQIRRIVWPDLSLTALEDDHFKLRDPADLLGRRTLICSWSTAEKIALEGYWTLLTLGTHVSTLTCLLAWEYSTRVRMSLPRAVK